MVTGRALGAGLVDFFRLNLTLRRKHHAAGNGRRLDEIEGAGEINRARWHT